MGIMSFFPSLLSSSLLTSMMLGLLLLPLTATMPTSAPSGSPLSSVEEHCLSETDTPRAWPTVRPITIYKTKSSAFRMVDINWVVSAVEEDDWVGVFKEDPNVNSLAKPHFAAFPETASGVVTSNITHDRPQVSQFIRSGCVGVWVAYMRNDTPIASECIRAHPQWMWDNREVLGGRTLRELVLPGSHNAGSYSTKDDMDAVQAWVVCQDEPVLTQLLYGNRYLDLRVGFYPNSSELLWVNHDLVQWIPLTEVLEDIRAFLALSPDPVVVDFHRFPVGFDQPEAHALLVSLLYTSLGSFMLPASEGPSPTLDRIWETGLQLIVGYADKDIAQEEPNLWPAVPHAWANTVIIQDLEEFLDDQMKRRETSPRIWSAMVQLTPTLWDILMKSSTGLRGFAIRTNNLVSTWMVEKWADLASVISPDFFLGSDIINTAIRINLHRATCSRSPRLLNAPHASPTHTPLEHLHLTLDADLGDFGSEGSGDECDEISLLVQNSNETQEEGLNSSSYSSLTSDSPNEDKLEHGSRTPENLGDVSEAVSSLNPTERQESNSRRVGNQDGFPSGAGLENEPVFALFSKLFTIVRVSNSTDVPVTNKDIGLEGASAEHIPEGKCGRGGKRRKNASPKRKETTTQVKHVDEEEMPEEEEMSEVLAVEIDSTNGEKSQESLFTSKEGILPHPTRLGDEMQISRRRREAQAEKKMILGKMLGKRKLLQILTMPSGTSKEPNDWSTFESSHRNRDIPSMMTGSEDLNQTLRLLQRRSILHPRLAFS